MPETRHKERRRSSRRSIVLSVELHHGSHNLGYFKTRNISYRGMFIETGPVSLSINEPVEVAFELSGISLEQERLTGVVEHCSEDGIGVMFTQYRSLAFHALRVLLFNAANRSLDL